MFTTLVTAAMVVTIFHSEDIKLPEFMLEPGKIVVEAMNDGYETIKKQLNKEDK